MFSTTNTDSTPAAFGLHTPKRFSRLRDFARHAGRRGRPYANAVDALNAGRWSTGPAGLRASRIGETAITEAYKAGQLERARSAMAEYAADHARNPRVERLIEIGARVTAVSDGDWSTLMTPDDLVDLASQFVAIDDREDAAFEAEAALLRVPRLPSRSDRRLSCRGCGRSRRRACRSRGTSHSR